MRTLAESDRARRAGSGPEPGPALAPAVFVVLFLLVHLGLRLWHASGWPEAGRFWDENVNVDNVRSLLTSGRFAPANGFYPSLAYLPQALALEALEAAGGLRAFDGARLTPGGYLVARFISVLYGVAVLGLTYLLGRRLFSPAVGLVGMVFLAAAPWQVHTSATWKPDSLLVLALLVVLHLAIDVAERGRLKSYLWSGVAIALALSSKFTAACAPLLLVMASALGPRQGRRVWTHLLAAGAVSLALFLLVNPQLPLFVRDFGWTVEDYGDHAAMAGTGRLAVVVGALRFPFDRFAHGRLVGGLAVAGLVMLATAGAGTRHRRAGRLLLLALPLLFVASYAAATSRVKPNNFVSILPVTSLLAALPVVALWLRGTARLPARRRAVVSALALVALATAAGGTPFRFVYRSRVPTTEDGAMAFLEASLQLSATDPRSRLVFAERWRQPVPPWEGRGRFGDSLTALVIRERLDELGAERRRAADGEIFFEDRPAAGTAEGSRERLEGRRGEVEVFRSVPFRLRGPAMVAVAHPWRKRSRSPLEVLPDGGSDESRLAILPGALRRGEMISLAVRLPRRYAGPDAGGTGLEIGGVDLELFPTSGEGRWRILISERFPVLGPDSLVSLRPALEPRERQGVRVDLYRWRPPRRPDSSRPRSR